MASSAAGGSGRAGTIGERHLPLDFNYNSFYLKYILNKPESEQDVGRTRLVQMMYQFSASVLSKISSNIAFMTALTYLKDSTMKSEYENLKLLKAHITSLGERVQSMRMSLEEGKSTEHDFEIADIYIKKIIDNLQSNYAAFFPKQAAERKLAANLYGNLLNSSEVSNIVMHLPPPPTHTPKGGRRKTRRVRRRRHRKSGKN